MIFFTISSLMFVYVFWRGIVPLNVAWRWKLPLSVLIMLFAFKPTICRYFFSNGPALEMPWWALAISGCANAAVVGLALLLIFRDLGLTLSLPLRRRRATARAASEEENIRATRTLHRDCGIMTAAALLGGWGTWQAMRVPEVRRVTVTLPQLPAALDGLRLAQLSDLHISATFPQAWTQAVVERTNALKPDLTLITGDLIDGTPWERRHDVAPLADLRARYGVFACTGNHEYYSGLKPWLRKFRSLGLTVLRDEHRVLSVNGVPLVLAGVSDLGEKRYGLKGPDVRRALAGSPAGALRILLAHQPPGAKDSARLGVDLQLSGHTHGGQVFPMNMLVWAMNEGYLGGLYRVGGMALYVSRGTGVWGGFPLRLFVPSEITEITLRRGGVMSS